MAKVKVYKQSGASAGELELSDSVFGCVVNDTLIHETAVAQAANARQGTKCTLTRAEVRGGGRKPWRQKGTGRARQGSIRSPQWIKGGVVFAPKPRDFSKKVNKQARRAATLGALSGKVRDNELIVVDKIESTGKTKEIAAMLKALKIESSALLVLSDKDVMVVRAANNIAKLKPLAHEYINVLDIIRHVKLIATKEAIKAIEGAYADETASAVVAKTETKSKTEKVVEAKPKTEVKAQAKPKAPAKPKTEGGTEIKSKVAAKPKADKTEEVSE